MFQDTDRSRNCITYTHTGLSTNTTMELFSTVLWPEWFCVAVHVEFKQQRA